MEEEIQERLKQNVPGPYETDIAPKPAVDTTTGQATVGPAYELDELTMYKVHDFFGQRYKDTDETAKGHARYVYEEVAKLIGTTEYSAVISKIIDLEGLIGTSHSENRMYKLYEWLRLDNIRKNTETQMQNLRYSDG